MGKISEHLFNPIEIWHIIDKVNYLKVKFDKQIESKVFDDTLSSLQENRRTSFVNGTIVSECVDNLCNILAQKVPDFLQNISWKHKIDWSKFSFEELRNTAKYTIITIHKKDILNIFDPGGLFWADHQIELEKSLYKAFPNNKIRSKELFTIHFNWIEYDPGESAKKILNPIKTLWFENTQYISSYEKLAKKIINLLDQESLIENNMAYLSSSLHRIHIDSMDISPYPFNENHSSFEETQSYELRVSMVDTILEVVKLLDSNSFINMEQSFDIVYDMIKKIKDSDEYDEEQKTHIFSKIKWMVINKLIQNVSRLYIGYWRLEKWIPLTDIDDENKNNKDQLSQNQIYQKYHLLHNVLKEIKDTKNNNGVYESIDNLLNLLESDTYHYFNYDNYKPWYIQNTQISAIRYCKLLMMIKETQSLQNFSKNLT